MKIKSRAFQETIDIITNFFKNRGYTIRISQLQETESSSWTCFTSLFYNDKVILNQAGKGLTKDAAIASGLGELFERFCNKIHVNTHPILSNKFLLLNKQKNNFYLDKNEIYLTPEDMYIIPEFQPWFDSMLINKKNSLLYIQSICQHQVLGVPYKNYFSNQVKYIDPRILTHIQTSTGMAAGNTLEEALIQGISEVFERIVDEAIFKDKQEKYFYINNNILPEYLKTIIKNIENSGNKFYLFDLSYNFHLPVCAAVLINKQTHNFNIDFAAAPYFEIAAERTITELYQNWQNSSIIKSTSQIPERSTPWYKILKSSFRNFPKSPYMIEDLLLSSSQINEYNSSIFLTGFTEDKEILQHYYNLAHKQNFDLFYNNNSLIETMFSIQIFVSNRQMKDFIPACYSNMPVDIKQQNINFWFNIYNYCFNYILTNNDFNIEDLEIKNISLDYQGSLRLEDIFNLYGEPNQLSDTLIIDLLKGKNVNAYSKPANFIYGNDFRKYYCSYLYNNNNYSNHEVQTLLELLDIDINIITKDQLIKLVLFENMKQTYFSAEHDNYLLGYCN